MKGLFKILVVVLIVLLSLPGIQQMTNLIKLKPLYGVTYEAEKVDLNFHNYLNFDYQLSVLKYVDQNFGFRPFFIRLYNQVHFSLYRISHGDGIIVGKDDYLYEEWFITDYLGYQNVGRQKIEEKINKLSKIRQFLNKYNTELLVVLSPGKSYYYPEYIPDYYVRASKYTNYEVYAELLRKSDVPTFDANGWFMELKGKEEAPLFPKTGTHWSYYGAEIVADSIIKISEQLLNRKLNHFVIDSLEWDDAPRDDDKDLEELSNLFSPINPIPHAYPILKHEITIPHEIQPQLITIADSFFWQIFDNSLDKSFNSISFWYYYNSVFPQWENHRPTVKDINVLEDLKKTDLVLLMVATAGLNKFGFGFIEDVYEKIQLHEESQNKVSNKTEAQN